VLLDSTSLRQLLDFRVQVRNRLLEQGPVPAVAGDLQILKRLRARQLQAGSPGLTLALFRRLPGLGCTNAFARLLDLIFDGLALPPTGHDALYVPVNTGV